MDKGHMKGHLVALLTIMIWGTTFVATKILLIDFTPIEILFFRFMMGFFALMIIYPHRLHVMNKTHELLFAAAGLSGITLYYLLENIALTYTMASNVGVISSLAPFFTAILAFFLLKEEPLRINFFFGFIVALIGISLISFSSVSHFQINPIGDILAMAATIIWAIYSIITRKISRLGYHTVQMTRKMFFYGILFMIPTLFLFNFKLELIRFTNPVNVLNMIFLGLGASALCFVTWNYAVKVLGPIKTSIYIYLIPVVTVVTSIIILDEKITWLAAIGIVLTLAGLFLSDGGIFIKKKALHAKQSKHFIHVKDSQSE